MITYQSGGLAFITKIFRVKGSVFPFGFGVALPAAAWAAVLQYLTQEGHLEYMHTLLKDNSIWGGFNFLVGFLVVFRTSQSYARFWDGCTATHKMRAEWFDACSALISFCRHSEESEYKIGKFQRLLVHLFSMLHAVSLAEIEDCNSELLDDIMAYKFEVLDLKMIDDQSLRILRESESKPELVFQWIQMAVVDNIKTGILTIPAPILSRAFQELANGMVAAHDAIKISCIPFPFPYAQTCDLLLLIHWLLCPLVVSGWVEKPELAMLFCFVQVFIVWTMNSIAVEIENPFGNDANDLDGEDMQIEMNRHLSLLVGPETKKTPVLVIRDDYKQNNYRGWYSLLQAWEDIEQIDPEVGVPHRGNMSEIGSVYRGSMSANTDIMVRSHVSTATTDSRFLTVNNSSDRLDNVQKLSEVTKSRETLRGRMTIPRHSQASAGSEVSGNSKGFQAVNGIGASQLAELRLSAGKPIAPRTSAAAKPTIARSVRQVGKPKKIKKAKTVEVFEVLRDEMGKLEDNKHWTDEYAWDSELGDGRMSKASRPSNAEVHRKSGAPDAVDARASNVVDARASNVTRGANSQASYFTCQSTPEDPSHGVRIDLFEHEPKADLPALAEQPRRMRSKEALRQASTHSSNILQSRGDSFVSVPALSRSSVVTASGGSCLSYELSEKLYDLNEDVDERRSVGFRENEKQVHTYG